ncbi:MAG TPA: efflux RND transporter periplasmic adaptor subunit [Bryobacteraceae bacterium]|nr:efflux RND transporter periplasmic adaptor subunit [Bryobacteraceae bacterium]
MRGKWVLISVSVVLVAVAAGALSVLRRESAERAAPAQPLAEPAPAPPGEVSLPGKILAQHVVPVGEQVSGNIDSFLADVGQDVFEGQLLARVANQGLEAAREAANLSVQSAQERVNKIEGDIIAARLEASRARADAVRSRGEYERAERTYRRQQVLHNAGATPRLTYERSERDFQKAQTEYDSLDTLARQAESRVNDLGLELQNAQKVLDDKKQQLEDIQTNLQGMEVHSPVAGVVVSRSGEVGKPHEEGAALFEIATDLSQLQVAVEPEPPVLARIQPGQPAMVIVADLQGQGIPGTVKEIRNTVVHVAFTSPSPVLRPGMTAQVRIPLN